MHNLTLNSSKEVIKGFFNLTYTKNNGAAFGLFGGKTVFIMIISFLVLLYLLFELFRHKKKNIVLDVSLSFLIGGLLGNLLDRIVYGSVRDFLDFNIFGYDFAIFNIGDVFIVSGCILFLIGVFMEETNENSSKRRIKRK